MKQGSEFVIELMTLYQILTDPKFWTACPELVELQAEGQQYRERVLKEVLQPSASCGTCGTLSTVLGPYFHKFCQHLSAKFQEDAGNLETFVDYISRKRGYRPVPILLYYKTVTGKNGKLQL